MTDHTAVTIYLSPFCPYCKWAKQLLSRKDVTFSEIFTDGNPEKFDEMVERSGGRVTVPQIFVGDVHVGGYDDMAALDRRGELDPLLFPES